MWNAKTNDDCSYLMTKNIYFAIVLFMTAIISSCAPAPENEGHTVDISSPSEKLFFTIREGHVDNIFFRDRDVSAHIVLSASVKPRMIVAFPAGNSGVSLWMESGSQTTQWRQEGDVIPVRETGAGGAMTGVRFQLAAETAGIDISKAVLGSVRHIRSQLYGETVPSVLNVTPIMEGQSLRWTRKRIDGRGAYDLRMTVDAGTIDISGGHVRLLPPSSGGPLRLTLTALTGDQPLTPIAQADLFHQGRQPGTALMRQILAFLSYEEKMLAGSWRFLTYFGRDTLMSLQLLMPVLSTTAVEAGLGSVLERINGNGEVAHEEDIGEFAAFRAQEMGRSPDGEPVYDYRMIDDDFMLAPVLAHYLLHSPQGRGRMDAFLGQRAQDGESYAEKLRRNAAFVLRQSAAFAAEPRFENMIALQEGSPVGEWRDSHEGLGHGRYAYNVNAVFVPSALEAIAALAQAGVLTGFDDAGAHAATWRSHAPRLFALSIDAAEARTRITRYAQHQQITAEAALSQDEGAQDIRFYAIALDAAGQPIPVLHSDAGFALLFGHPSEDELDLLIRTLQQPFPAGLLTPIGLLVANPAYADDAVQNMFTRDHYHGTVVWSWQQALLAAGVETQLQRADLSADMRDTLEDLNERLWQAIDNGRDLQNSELWSWSFQEGRFVAEPFGQRVGHRSESNAAQLWSTVYLALERPIAAWETR